MKTIVAVIAVVVASSLASAAPPRKVATVEGISEYQLDNGLRVLLFPDSSKPTITVNVTYFVGSRHEGYGETGMAHLLEHMLFKGTRRRPKLAAELDNHGARFNGSTNFDRTNYFEIFSASDENLAWALDLEADRMVNSRVSKEDLATEFSVVRNEFEIGENSPRDILEERMLSTAYLWHNYGKSPIGSRSDIERVPIENLQSFYRRFYQPDNAMLVIAGKIEPAKVLAAVGATFGKLPRPKRTLPASYTVEPVQDGERNVVLRRAGDIGVVGLTYHGVPGASADFVAEEAIAHLLTHKPTGRLYQALVAKGLATQLSAEAYPTAQPGVLVVLANVPAGKPVDPVRDTLVSVVEGLAKSPITAEELQRYKSDTLKQIELGLTDSARVGIRLSDWAAQGDWRLLFLHRDAVKALDVGRVRAFAQQYLKPSNRTAATFVAEKSIDRAPLPAQPDVVALVKDYKGQAGSSEGEAFEASIANIEKRTERSTLASGMKLALLAKKTRGQAAKIVLRINAGAESDLRGLVDAVALLPDMVQRGTKKHTYQQLRDELDRLRAELHTGGGGDARPGEATLTVTTVRDSVPAVLALLGEMVREPAFTPAEFETLKAEQVARLEGALQQPEPLAHNLLTKHAQPWPKDDVRYHASLAERLERLRAVKLEQLVAFHKSFWGASDGQLVLVGDFDAAAVKQASAREFGGWKAPRPWKRIATPYRAPELADELVLTPDKQMAMVGFAQPLALRESDADYPALRFAEYLFGSGFKSRLLRRLRQNEGLSYTAGSFLSTDALDDSALLTAYALCAPQNATKAMASLVDELQILVGKGVPADELKQGKQAWAEHWKTRLSSDDAVAALLAEGLYANRPLGFYDQLNAAIAGVTSAQVTAALAKHIKVDQLVKVRAGDLKRN
jgi:zinc protease